MHVAKGLVNYSEDYIVKIAGNLDEYVNLLARVERYVFNTKWKNKSRTTSITDYMSF